MVNSLRVSYGAIDLKRVYRRHLLTGTGLAAMLMATTVSMVWLFTGTAEMVTVPIRTVDTLIVGIDPWPLPGIGRPPSETAEPKEVSPGYGIPMPVEDGEAVDENVVMATRDELKRRVGAPIDGDGGPGGNMIIVPSTEEYIPPPDVFVPVEIEPAPVHEVTPEYPRLAREGGFGGVVTLQVYVDENGVVRKVLVAACSRPGMGFEEAAVKAASLGKWRPGVQNGRPVGVWIAYRVKFELE